MKENKRVSSSQWKSWVTAVIALGILAAWGYRLFRLQPSDRFIKKPVMNAPDFSFKSQEGKDFTSAELEAKVWVTDFIFTSCAGSCPVLSEQMMRLQDAWKGNLSLKLVSFTVDPQRDTVEALRKYAANLQADPQQWVFLTGEKKNLYAAIREGFKATAEPAPEAGPGFDFIHTTRMYLVDGKGMIRGWYDGTQEEDMKKLHQDLEYLLGSRNPS